MSNIPNISRISARGTSASTSAAAAAAAASHNNNNFASGGTILVGDSVLVENMGKAIVKYVGPTKFRPGIWIGVEFDKAIGKNNGTVQDVQYFSCPNDCGLFLHPSKVTPISTTLSVKQSSKVSSPIVPNKKSAHPVSETGITPPPPLSEGKSSFAQTDSSSKDQHQLNEIFRYKKRLETSEKELEKATTQLFSLLDTEGRLVAENTALRNKLVEREIALKKIQENSSDEMVDALRKEIFELKNEREMYSRKLEVLEAEYGDELNSLRTENSSLKKENASVINAQKSQIETLKETINQLELDLTMVKAEQNVAKEVERDESFLSLKADRENILNALNQAKRENENISNNFDVLKVANEEIASRNKLLEKQIADLRENLKTLTEKSSAQQDLLVSSLKSEWESEKKKFQDDATALELELEGKQAELIGFRKDYELKITKLTDDLGKATEARAKMAKLLDEKNSEAAALSQKIMVLNRELDREKDISENERDAVIQSLKNELSTQEENYKNLESQVKSLTEENEKISSRQLECMANLESETQLKEQLKSSLQEKDSQLQKTSNRISELDRLVTSLKSEMELSRQEHMSLKSKHEKLLQDFHQKTESEKIALDQVKEIESKHSELCQKSKSLMVELQESKSKVTSSESRIKSLEASAKTLHDSHLQELRDLRKDSDEELLRQTSILTKEVGQLKGAVADLKESKKSLEDQLVQMKKANSKPAEDSLSSDMMKDFTELKKLCEEKDGIILEKGELLERQQLDFASLKSEYEKMKIKALEEKKFWEKELERISKELAQEKSVHTVEVSTLEKELSAIKSKLNKIESGYQESNQKLQDLIEKYDILMEEKNQIEKTFSRYEASVKENKTPLALAPKRLVTSYASEINLASESDEKLNEKVQGLKGEVESLDNLILSQGQLSKMVEDKHSISLILKRVEYPGIEHLIGTRANQDNEVILGAINDFLVSNPKTKIEELEQLVEKQILKQMELEETIQAMSRKFDSNIDLAVFDEDGDEDCNDENGLKGAARQQPFCENCETFGHETSYCDKIDEMY